MINIRSKTEKELLIYYFCNTNAKHHLHELARILHLDSANLDKKLKQLVKIGLFTAETRGNQKIYSINHKFPLFKEYKSIINKTYGIDNLLTKTLNKISGIQKAYIFGSYTTQKFDQFSDIDLLIIGDNNSLKLSKALHIIEKKINREINAIEISTKEYQKTKKTNPLLKNIFKQKTIQII